MAFESSSPPGTEVELGFAERLGGGLTREAYGAGVELRPDPDGRSDAYVALISSGREPDYDERVRREAEVLGWLAERSLGVRAPQLVALVEDHGSAILVESFVAGVVVDHRAGRQPIVPWELVAEVAATIHAVPPPPSWAPRTRREHRRETLEAFGGFAPRFELVNAALEWMRDHLGDAAPGVLLHGDLLGQNLRLHPSDKIGVIDWYYVEVGDPAAELAILTRGARRPFQVGGGRQKLLDAYNERAATEVSAESLRFFELAMVTRWVVEGGDDGQLDGWLRKIERMLGIKSV